MRKPPDVKQFHRFPVTAATCLLAIAVTFALWGHWNVEPLLEDGNVRRWQLWRLITSALPHTSPYHLIFNVYWTWVFGTLIEEVFGHFKTAAIFIFLALGSGAAEYALMNGGVGLSGVGYGLFGMLWVLSHRDARFAGAVDANTVALFVIWFFICIVLDATGAMPIANVAHGSGALLGGMVGWAISARGTLRTVRASTAALFVVAAVGGATIGRPWVNFAKDGSHGEFELGFEALNANRMKKRCDGFAM
jgi:membrane associated rhomboid family serine protease